MSWREHAACAGTFSTLFFPMTGMNATEARRVCARCRSQTACLMFAVNDSGLEYGVWGGATSKERAQIRAGTFTVRRLQAKLDAL